LTVFNEQLVFVADDSTSSTRIWMTDESGADAVPVWTLSAGIELLEMFVYENEFYFSYVADEVGLELWKSDGTAQGTRQLTDLEFRVPANASISSFSILDGVLHFIVTDGRYGSEIWKTDGTSEGTTNLTDRTWDFIFDELTAVGDTLYFYSTADFPHEEGIWQWKDESLSQVPGLPAFGTGAELFVYDNRLIVSGNGGLWIGSGELPMESFHDSIGRQIRELEIFGDEVYFVAGSDLLPQTELWKSDGTTAGTERIVTRSAFSSAIGFLTEVAGQLYFLAEDDVSRQSLWKTDGTAVGTFRQPGDARTEELTAVGDRLFVVASQEVSGTELWSGIADPNRWQNPEVPTDVDHDGVTSPLDALLVINELNERLVSSLVDGALPDSPATSPFLDVNDDGFVAPGDALIIINALQGGGDRSIVVLAQGVEGSCRTELWRAAFGLDDQVNVESVNQASHSPSPRNSFVDHVFASDLHEREKLDSVAADFDDLESCFLGTFFEQQH
jgi:ELWxxDGT repeat protein